jgi:hypothetical protein
MRAAPGKIEKPRINLLPFDLGRRKTQLNEVAAALLLLPL